MNAKRAIGLMKHAMGEDALLTLDKLPQVGDTIPKSSLKNILDDINDVGNGYFGIRSIDPADEVPSLWGKVKPSKKWRVGGNGDLEPTRFNADGPSALEIGATPFSNYYGERDYLDMADSYYGNKYILQSEDLIPLKDWNVDHGEIVMDSPRVVAGFEPVDRDTWKRILSTGGLMATGAGVADYAMPDDAQAAYIGPKGLANLLGPDAAKSLLTEAEQMAAKGVDNEAIGQAVSVPKGREWVKGAGNNTSNIAQAFAPNDPFSPSPSQLAAAGALVAALKAKDQPLEDAYQPADLVAAFLTGGAGLAPKVVSAAMDPIFSTGMEYLPKVADAINPRNIIMGFMR